MQSIQDIMKAALEANASDIHVTVGTRPHFRVSGRLVPFGDDIPTPEYMKDAFESITDKQTKDRFTKRGDYEFSYSDPAIGRFRVNAYRQRGSVSLAIRLVGERIPTVEDTHVPSQLADIAKKRSGLVIATGTAGSGKSTTLAVIIDIINRTRNAHVITLEEPIEFLHKHGMSIIDQREVGVDSRNYEESIRSAIRSDPDIIMIEDMQEPAVTQMAIAAAESGKLVLSTIVAPSAQAALEKLLNVFPPQEKSPIRTQLARVLDTVFCQQLVPAEDGSRVAAFEILNARFREARACIREGNLTTLADLIRQNPKSNMLAMDDDLANLVRTQVISREHAARFARDPSYLNARISD